MIEVILKGLSMMTKKKIVAGVTLAAAYTADAGKLMVGIGFIGLGCVLIGNMVSSIGVSIMEKSINA